jgi:hypothetical protein
MTARLGIGATLRRTFQLFRAEWRLLVALTVLVEVPVMLGGALSIRFLELDVSRVPDVESVPTGLILLVWTTLAHHLLLAVVERIEAAHRGGETRAPIGAVMRDLPIVNLLIADVLITIAIVIGVILLIIPGLIIAVWTAPVFPLLTMERKPLKPTVRRSIAIVRGNEWRLFALIVMLSLASQAVGFVAAWFFENSPFLDAATHFGIVLVFEPLSTAAVVVATFALVDIHDARTAPAAAPAA